MTPYNGYGCLDTLYAVLIDTLTTVADAGNDIISCNNTPVQIGAKPKPGLTIRWSPANGLSNPLQSQILLQIHLQPPLTLLR